MSGFKTRRIVAPTVAAMLAVGGIGGTTVANAAAPKTGGTIYLLTNAEQFEHMDPGRIYVGQQIALVSSYLFRTLVSYNPIKGKAASTLVPDLATNTGVPTNSAKTWTFTLRKGATFQDGSEIKCEDVKYGISRSFATDVITDGPQYMNQYLDIPKDKDGNSQYAGPYKKTGQALFDKAVTCKGQTLTINLNQTVADFNYTMTYPNTSPVQASKDTGEKYDLTPDATGPYMIQKYKINDELVLVRNTKWVKASDPIRTPYPDEIRVRFGLAEDVRDQIILDDSTPNSVNLDGLLPANTLKFFNNSKYSPRRLNVMDPYVTYYMTNVSKGHLDCLDVRKAIFFAMNSKALIDLSGGTRLVGQMGDNPVKPALGTDYVKTKGNIHDPNYKITGNPTYAKTFLDKAKTSCPSTYAKVTGSEGFSVDLAQSARNQKASVLIKTAMAAAGMNVTFNFLPPGTYYTLIGDTEKQGDMSRAGWGADWANASTVIPPLFLYGTGYNYTQNWTDEATFKPFKAKVDKAIAETNRAKQAEMWKALSQEIMDNYWLIHPVFGKAQMSWGSGIGGVYFWEPQGTFGFGQLYVK